MTNNESHPDAVDDLIAMLSNVQNSDDEFDVIATVVGMRELLVPDAYSRLAVAFDMCPIHDQDLDSCRDDDILADTLSDLSNPPSTAGYDVPLTACRHLR